MGFALWVDHETAWCAGTHEYRPMGVAVIAATSLFSARDFDGLRPAPAGRSGENFHGLFASLVDVNSYMSRRRAHSKRGARAGRRRRRRQQLLIT